MSEEKRIGQIIENYVAYFNGWRVDDSTMRSDCLKAAKEILNYLKRRRAQLNRTSAKRLPAKGMER